MIFLRMAVEEQSNGLDESEDNATPTLPSCWAHYKLCSAQVSHSVITFISIQNR